MTWLARRTRLLLVVALVVFAIAHLPKLTSPPTGYHEWRESDVAAIILKFHTQDLPLWEPQTFEIASSSGGLKVELSVYAWLASLGYDLLGVNHAFPRGLTLLFAIIGLVSLYGIIRLHGDALAAAMTVWALAFSPLYFFYSFKIMPEIMMISLGVLSLMLFEWWRDKGDWTWLVVSALVMALAAATKPFVLGLYLPMLILRWRQRGLNVNTVVSLAVHFAIAVTPLMLWIAFTGWLLQRTGHVTSFWESVLSDVFFKHYLLQWPWELWVGWTLVPAFLMGIWCAIKRRIPTLIYWWILAACIVLTLVAAYSRTHDYYSLLIVPAFAAITGSGLARLAKGNRWQQVICVVLLVAAPVGAWARVEHRFGSAEEYITLRAESARLIPEDARVIVQDETRGAVRLYRLLRDGWSVSEPIETGRVTQLVKQGADYLIVNQPLDSEMTELDGVVFGEPFELGPLVAYPVSRPEAPAPKTTEVERPDSAQRAGDDSTRTN